MPSPMVRGPIAVMVKIGVRTSLRWTSSISRPQLPARRHEAAGRSRSARPLRSESIRAPSQRATGGASVPRCGAGEAASFDLLRKEAAEACRLDQRSEPSRLRARDPDTQIGDAVVVSPLVARIRRRPAVRGLDQTGFRHACEGAVHRPHVRDRCFAAPFNVLNDSVAVPFAGCEAEEDVKLDPPQWQVSLDPAVPIHSHEILALPCAAHIVYAPRMHACQGHSTLALPAARMTGWVQRDSKMCL